MEEKNQKVSFSVIFNPFLVLKRLLCIRKNQLALQTFFHFFTAIQNKYKCHLSSTPHHPKNVILLDLFCKEVYFTVIYIFL